MNFYGNNNRMAGRPKKSDHEKRTNVLRMCLTESERAQLDDVAKLKGMDTSSWARLELVAIARKLLKGKQAGHA